MEYLMRSKEAAKRLGVAPKTLDKWRWSGQGPAYIKVGGLALYHPEDLRKWIDTRRRTSTSDPGPGR